MFHLKCTKPKQNYVLNIAELQNHFTDLLNFQFKGVWMTYLAQAKLLFKIILGINVFVNRFSILFASLFKTFGMQRDDNSKIF